MKKITSSLAEIRKTAIGSILLSTLLFSSCRKYDLEQQHEEPKVASSEMITEPEFQGGFSAMCNYIGKEIHYPVEAQKKKLQGTVFIQFVVDRYGQVQSVKVAKGVNPLLDEEAKRVASNMPKWIPAAENGMTVSRLVTLPIKFE